MQACMTPSHDSLQTVDLLECRDQSHGQAHVEHPAGRRWRVFPARRRGGAQRGTVHVAWDDALEANERGPVCDLANFLEGWHLTWQRKEGRKEGKEGKVQPKVLGCVIFRQ